MAKHLDELFDETLEPGGFLPEPAGVGVVEQLYFLTANYVSHNLHESLAKARNSPKLVNSLGRWSWS